MSPSLTDAVDTSRIGRYAMKTGFFASISARHAATKRNSRARRRTVANLSSEGWIPLDCSRHGNADNSCLRSSPPWELMHGVVNSMPLALVLLAIRGLRYPLKMPPLLFWEIAWKATWLRAV